MVLEEPEHFLDRMTIYETSTSGEQSGNGGLNNLGQPPFLDSASGMEELEADPWLDIVWVQLHQLPPELQMELMALEEEEQQTNKRWKRRKWVLKINTF